MIGVVLHRVRNSASCYTVWAHGPTKLLKWSVHLRCNGFRSNGQLGYSIHPLGPYSVQSVGAAEAVSLDIGYNTGRIATPTKDTSKLAHMLLTSEGWQAESTSPGINSKAKWDLNSGSEDPKPTTQTIKPTPGVCIDWSSGFDLGNPSTTSTIAWTITSCRADVWDSYRQFLYIYNGILLSFHVPLGLEIMALYQH